MSLVIDSKQHSVAQEVIYRRTWTIENFPGLMEFSRPEDLIVPADLEITVPNEGTSVWRLKCNPKIPAMANDFCQNRGWASLK